MSGTINLAFSQQFDMDGAPLSGGLLYFFTAGTTTPQSAFQDTGLTITHPNPMILDASGRVPMFYLSDGFIKIRLTDKNGVTVIAADQLLVIGPSSGGGGGGGSAGDVTAALQTGDIKARYDTAVKDGFVRLNGLTIGNVGSSATERQEAVCQPLFEYLWAFPNITLDGFAKGANALADFGASRRLILPDLRGRTIAGLDDMGATAALRLTSVTNGFGVSATVLGNASGGQNVTLGAANLPTHSHAVLGSSSNESPAHSHGGGTLAVTIATAGTGDIALGPPNAAGGTSLTPAGGSNVYTTDKFEQLKIIPAIAPWTGTTTTGAHSHGLNFTSGDGAGTFLATPAGLVQPTMVMTWYMKL